jgi:hypothetical protein
MKNKLTLTMMTLMVFWGLSVSSQPVLTATGINSVVGESFTQNNGGYVNPGSSGANQTWDLSSMAPAGSLTSVVAPGTTTYGSSFPNANVAWTTASGTALYLKTSSSANQNYGMVSGTTVIPYSNPEDLLHYPFSYTNTYTDTWAAQFQSGGYTFYRSGSTTVTADGYGTLITPNGTYTDVMRVHLVQNYLDSANVGGPYIIEYNNDEYMWYKEGIHVQLAFVYNFTSTGGGSASVGSYISGNVGIETEELPNDKTSVFPNPATGKISICIGASLINEEFTLLNGLGLTVATGHLSSAITTIDLSSFPSGIYMLILGNDREQVIKLIKE